MHRTLTIVLALLLAVSAPAIALKAPTQTLPSGSAAESAAATPIEPGNDTAGRMVLPRDAEVTSAFITPSLDLGGSIGIGHDSLQNKFDAYYLDQKMAAANSSTEKRKLLFQFTYRIEKHITELKTRDRTARLSYANGTLSTKEYLRTVGRIDAEAERTKSLLDLVNFYSARTPDSNLNNRVSSLKLELVPVEGPVRDRIAKTMQGEEPGVKIYIASANSGVVLSMIVDGNEPGILDATYVREAYRSDVRSPNQTDRLSPEQGYQLAHELYPWATDTNNTQSIGVRPKGDINIFPLVHDHGEITAYVDSSSENVYRETQHKQLSEIPLKESVRNTTDGVTIMANRTYAGGPLQLTLLDAETNETINGSITIGDERIGTTGEDGVLWTVAPRGTYTVEAATSFNTVNLTVHSPSRSTLPPSEG